MKTIQFCALGAIVVFGVFFQAEAGKIRSAIKVVSSSKPKSPSRAQIKNEVLESATNKLKDAISQKFQNVLLNRNSETMRAANNLEQHHQKKQTLRLGQPTYLKWWSSQEKDLSDALKSAQIDEIGSLIKVEGLEIGKSESDLTDALQKIIWSSPNVDESLPPDPFTKRVFRQVIKSSGRNARDTVRKNHASVQLTELLTLLNNPIKQKAERELDKDFSSQLQKNHENEIREWYAQSLIELSSSQPKAGDKLDFEMYGVVRGKLEVLQELEVLRSYLESMSNLRGRGTIVDIDSPGGEKVREMEVADIEKMSERLEVVINRFESEFDGLQAKYLKNILKYDFRNKTIKTTNPREGYTRTIQSDDQIRFVDVDGIETNSAAEVNGRVSELNLEYEIDIESLNNIATQMIQGIDQLSYSAMEEIGNLVSAE